MKETAPDSSQRCPATRQEVTAQTEMQELLLNIRKSFLTLPREAGGVRAVTYGEGQF